MQNFTSLAILLLQSPILVLKLVSRGARRTCPVFPVGRVAAIVTAFSATNHHGFAKPTIVKTVFHKWSLWRELHPRPAGYKSAALNCLSYRGFGRGGLTRTAKVIMTPRSKRDRLPFTGLHPETELSSLWTTPKGLVSVALLKLTSYCPYSTTDRSGCQTKMEDRPEIESVSTGVTSRRQHQQVPIQNGGDRGNRTPNSWLQAKCVPVSTIPPLNWLAR